MKFIFQFNRNILILFLLKNISISKFKNRTIVEKINLPFTLNKYF